jgi:hypothetical protein
VSSPSDPSAPDDPITDPGVDVATGDPDKIDEAGGFHHAVAEKLEAHSALIRSTASFLLNGWNGQASKEFHIFSSDLSSHYEVTASEARAVGSALKKFASELGRSQGEGRTALKNAIHWMNEVNHWQNKLSDISKQQDVAETNIHTAMLDVVAARSALSSAQDPKEIPGLTDRLNTANGTLASARQHMADLQNDQAQASKQWYNASEYFTTWQKKGGQALQDAELAAGVAGYALGIVTVNSPPVARVVDAALQGPSGSVSGSVSAGLSGSRNYGTNLANGGYSYLVGASAQGSMSGSVNAKGIRGDIAGSATAGAQGNVQGHLGYTQFGVDANGQGLVGGQANGELNDGIGLSGVNLDNNASVFAGAQLSGGMTQNVGFFSVSENGQLSAGAGANAGETFEVTANKVEFSWNLGASVGLGAGGGISVSFDPEEALHDGEHAYDFVAGGVERYGGDAVHGTENLAKKVGHDLNPLNW